MRRRDPDGASGEDSDRGFIIACLEPSPASGDQFGKALTIGHFSFTTKDYLAVGAQVAAGGGLVAIFDTTTTGVTRASTLTQSNIPGMSPETGDQFGAALAHGDLDGDGLDDLVIGVPGENSSQGVIALVQGGTMAGWTWRGEKDDGWTR